MACGRSGVRTPLGPLMKLDGDAKLAKRLYNEEALSYLEKHRANPIVIGLRKRVNKLLGEVKGKNILFIGCGDGSEARYAIENGAKVTGIDISERCINAAKRNFPKENFLVMDFENSDFEDGQFDMIVSIFSIMYKRNLKHCLEELKRIKKKDGIMVIVVPHPVRKMVKYSNMDYFVRGKKFEVWEGNKRFNYYRILEDYINTITEIGLKIDKVFEHKETVDTYPHNLVMVIS